MTEYFNLFNGNPVQPSQVSYRQITLNASQTLSWTTSGFETANIVTLEIDLISNNASYTLKFPPANQVSTGISVLIYNKGTHNTSILNNGGTQIANAVAGTVIFLYLTDNSTVNGLWNTFTFGTGTSSADASTLAGLGLKAIGSLLNTNINVNTLGAITSYDALESDNASLIVWTGGIGTIQLPDPGNVYPGYYVSVHNASTVGGQVTMLPQTGNYIDGDVEFEINPGQSSFFVLAQDNQHWYTLGFGQETFFSVGDLVIDVTGKTSITIDDIQSQNLLQFYTGVLSNDVKILLPDVNGQYYIFNQTTGAFNLFIALQSTPLLATSIAQGQSLIFASNGTTLYTIPSQPPTALFGDGTQASPSIAFASEPDLGFYKAGTGVMGFAVGGITTPLTFTITGPKVINGSLTNPSISFIAQSDLGFYRVASNTLGVAVNNVLPVQFVQTGMAIIAGSASNPSLSFIGSPTYGLNLTGGNTVATSIAGINLFTVAAASITCISPVVASSGITLRTAGTLQFNNTGNTNSIILQAAGALAANATYTLPSTLPSVSGQLLASTTGGVMSWVSPGSSGLSLPNGTAGAPALAFTAYPTTGIYAPGSNLFGISSQGIGIAVFALTGINLISGTQSYPSYSFLAEPTSGMWNSTGQLNFSALGNQVITIDESGLTIFDGRELILGNATNAFFTSFGVGTLTVDSHYVLPLAQPTVSGMALISSNTGTMDWSTSSFRTDGILVPNGSVGAPSLAFTGSPTSGFYRFAADEISVACAGTQIVNFALTAVTVDTQFVLETANSLKFNDGTNAQGITFAAPASVSSSYNVIWPSALPAANDFLKVSSVVGNIVTLVWGT